MPHGDMMPRARPLHHECRGWELPSPLASARGTLRMAYPSRHDDVAPDAENLSCLRDVARRLVRPDAHPDKAANIPHMPNLVEEVLTQDGL